MNPQNSFQIPGVPGVPGVLMLFTTSNEGRGGCEAWVVGAVSDLLHAMAPIRIRATPFPPRIERNPTLQVLGRIQTATDNFPMSIRRLLMGL